MSARFPGVRKASSCLAMLSGRYRLDRTIASAALSDVDQILMSPVGIAVPWFYSEAVQRCKGRVVMRVRRASVEGRGRPVERPWRGQEATSGGDQGSAVHAAMTFENQLG